MREEKRSDESYLLEELTEVLTDIEDYPSYEEFVNLVIRAKQIVARLRMKEDLGW